MRTIKIMGMAALLGISLTACWGADKDDDGKADNRERYKVRDNSSDYPGKDHGASTSSIPGSVTPPDNTRTTIGKDSSLFEAFPPK